MRPIKAEIHVNTPRGTKTVVVSHALAYDIDTALDNDADTFSVDFAAPELVQFISTLARDNEVWVNVYTNATNGEREALHFGIADKVMWDSETLVLSIAGRDRSAIAVDSHPLPHRWRSIRGDLLIQKQALSDLGLGKVQIMTMRGFDSLYVDGSESYWAFWYRIMRNRGGYLWCEPDGRIIGDKLNYSVSPTYFFGDPRPGQARGQWIPVVKAQFSSEKNKRKANAIVYAQTGKNVIIGNGADPLIQHWARKPQDVLADSKAKNRAEANQVAFEDVIEGRVAAQEITVVIADPGFTVQQNTIAQLSLPKEGIDSQWFVVGVRKVGGSDGATQEIRLREKNYAVSRQIPTAPDIKKSPFDNPNTLIPVDAVDQITGQSTSGNPAGDIRWGTAFALAANEHGRKNGWDYDTFLGILLSIGQHETGFTNVRERNSTPFDGWEWQPYEAFIQNERNLNVKSEGELEVRYHKAFDNQAGSTYNPFNPREAGVGPMQLTSTTVKEYADKLSPDGRVDQLQGGRWTPENNIMAAAYWIDIKLRAAGADPGNLDSYWLGVRAYAGDGPLAQKYMLQIRAIYEGTFKDQIAAAAKSAATIKPGDKVDVTLSDGHKIVVSDSAPEAVRIAVNYALRQLHKPYEWGATGPDTFDCSGLCMAAYREANISLPHNTVAMWNFLSAWAKSNFGYVIHGKDDLRPGDLVFFNNLEHMGMFLGMGTLFIQAPHTGDYVKISSLGDSYYRDNYSGARRAVLWL